MTNKSIERKNFIFLLGFFLEILAMQISITTIPYMVDTYSCNLILKLLRYTGYAIVLWKILNDDYTSKEITIIILIMMILVLNSAIVGGNTILCLFLFVVGMRGVDFKLVCRISLVWYMAGVVITIVSSQIGLIENWEYTSGNRIRFALGYFYPSHATSAIFYTMCLLCYVLGDKIRLGHVCILEVLNYLQYRETDARAGTLLMYFIPIAFWVIKIDKKEISKRIYGNIMTMAFPVCAALSIIGAKIYSGQGILYKINLLISNRIALAHKALDTYGVSLLGQKIEWIGNGGYGHVFTEFKEEYNYVDCSYVKILLEYGSVFFAIVLIGFTMAAVRAMKDNDKYLLTVLAFIAVYSMIEPRLIEIGFNSFVPVLAVLVDTVKVRNDKCIMKKMNILCS